VALNQVILKRFNMTDFPDHPELVVDEAGRLYDRQARAMVDPLLGPEAARRLECFAAMRWLMKRMHQHMERWVERHGLTEGRLLVLMHLRRQGDRPLGELADLMMVSPRNVTGLMDHLERDGLVERVPDPADRRSVRARLTDSGRELIDRIWRDSLEQSLALTDDIPQEDLDVLRHTCLRMIKRIEYGPPAAAGAEQRSRT
jgi:DNA-binding MarR family transcriptional regulator